MRVLSARPRGARGVGGGDSELSVNVKHSSGIAEKAGVSGALGKTTNSMEVFRELALETERDRRTAGVWDAMEAALEAAGLKGWEGVGRCRGRRGPWTVDAVSPCMRLFALPNSLCDSLVAKSVRKRSEATRLGPAVL